uniref:NACHT domain-containing protein n=1 Tax=Fusarium oxysporum (strain Fo5176) TaxID=660025 RepID=A0A0D2XLE5_FUSOF
MAHYKETVSNNIGIIGNLKGVIDQAVKASPEAGVAWAGISVGLERLSLLPNWASVLLRDTLKLDDWAERLKDVKDAESNLRQDFEQYNTEEIKLWLSGIANIAKSQEALLENICASIQQEARARERREQEEWDTKNMECFAAFQLTDPQLDKIEIQKRKGAPLWDSYSWVLQHDAYNKLDDSSSRVLWINGEPGKGKTMLLCGIIDELKKSLRPVSYFFCQVTDEDLSNDTAVMRGLIYVLLDQQPSLISEVRPYYDKREDKLFSGKNSNVLLSEILTKLLQDPSMQNAVLVVDALDECKSGRDRFIMLIGDLSCSCSARWIISSRNWPEIARGLRDTQGLVPLELENNTELVAGAVQAYIRTRVDHLGKNWDNDTNLMKEVFESMVSRTDNTFLTMEVLEDKLVQDIYQLKSPGTLVDEISTPDPDPLPPIKYLCTHWVDHFIDSDSVSTQDDKVLAQALHFLMKKFTSWLEATSLLRVFSVAIKSILKLESALMLVDLFCFTKWPLTTRPYNVCLSTSFSSKYGKFLASVYKVEIFDLGTRTVDCIAKLDVRADLVVFLPVDKQLVTLENDEELCWNIWNWNTGEHLQSIVDPNEFYVKATFLPHGRMITVPDYEAAKVWNIATGRCEQALEGHSDQIVSVACSSDGKRLATGSWDCTVKVWHTSVMGEWTCEKTLYHKNAVHAVLISPDGRILVSADWDHCIRIWNDAGILVKTLNGHIKGLNGLSLHENGQWLVSSTKAGYMMLWDISPAYSSSASQNLAEKVDKNPHANLPNFSMATHVLLRGSPFLHRGR